MKTTSYEISKKLKEIGFKAEAHHKLRCFKDDFLYSYYDLETILEALPAIINKNRDHGWGHFGEELSLKKHEIGYYYQDYDVITCKIVVKKEESESLADTAARLLILLESKGLINFKKK